MVAYPRCVRGFVRCGETGSCYFHPSVGSCFLEYWTTFIHSCAAVLYFFVCVLVHFFKSGRGGSGAAEKGKNHAATGEMRRKYQFTRNEKLPSAVLQYWLFNAFALRAILRSRTQTVQGVVGNGTSPYEWCHITCAFALFFCNF